MKPAVVQAPCGKCGRVVVTTESFSAPEALCQGCVGPVEQRLAMERLVAADPGWRRLAN